VPIHILYIWSKLENHLLLCECVDCQVLEIQCERSTQFRMLSKLNNIQNYSAKFEIHARNPVLICYYNVDDTYRVQYFSSSSSSYFSSCSFHRTRYWQRLSLLSVTLTDGMKNAVGSLRHARSKCIIRHCQSHPNVCDYTLWCCTHWRTCDELTVAAFSLMSVTAFVLPRLRQVNWGMF
jgi:hypothetical protein